MTDEKSGHADEKHAKVGGGAENEAAAPDRKPEGVGPVDKKPEVEQQPT